MQNFDDYVASAPESQRPILTRLLALQRELLPDCEETLDPFPVFTRNGQWVAGFATRKKGPMLYVMAEGVLDRHAEAIGKRRSGVSCIEFGSTKTESEDDLLALAKQLLAEAALATK